MIPFVLMRVGGALSLSPSVAAVMALSYMVPWCVANVAAAGERRRASAYAARPRSGDNGGGGDGYGGGHGGSGSNGSDDDADCGGCGAPAPAPLPSIAPSDALRNILEALPDSVYITAGDCCSVCLETFPDGAAEVRRALVLYLTSAHRRSLPSVFLRPRTSTYRRVCLLHAVRVWCGLRGSRRSCTRSGLVVSSRASQMVSARSVVVSLLLLRHRPAQSAGPGGSEASRLLMALIPPIVALRCGAFLS